MPTKKITMANKIMTVAFAIVSLLIFASCEKSEVEAWDWNNGHNPTPASYSLDIEHVSASYQAGKISDLHLATLLKDNQAVASKQYTAKHNVSVNTVAVKRTVAEGLVGKTIAYTDGFNLNGAATLTVSIALDACENVYFEESGKIYCHKNFLKDGAIAALTACNWTPSILKIGEIDGNILNGTVIVKDQDNVEIPVEISVSEDDVRTVEYSDATVKTPTSVEIIKTVKVNGNITETTPITIAIAAGLECGDMIETSNLSTLTYGANAAVANGAAAVSMNIVNFTAIVTMPTSVQFFDEGANHTANVVWNTLYVTSNGNIKVDNNSSENIDIMNTAYFKLVCDGIDMANDTKQIHQTKRIYAEFEKEENGDVTFILHGEKDVRFTAPSGISLVAGADQTKEVANLELSANGNTNGNWAATGTKTNSSVKYTSYRRVDSYSYSNGINNTVTVTKNDNYVIVYKGHEYPVSMSEVVVSATAPVKGNVNVANGYKSCAFSLNYTASRNNTSASDETVVTLKKKVAAALIDGYHIDWVDLTDNYRTKQAVDCQSYMAHFTNDTDSSKKLVAKINFSGNSASVEKSWDASAWNVNRSTYLSRIFTGAEYVPASLIVVESGSLQFKYTSYANPSLQEAFVVSGTLHGLNDPFKERFEAVDYEGERVVIINNISIK